MVPEVAYMQWNVGPVHRDDEVFVVTVNALRVGAAGKKEHVAAISNWLRANWEDVVVAVEREKAFAQE